MAIINHIPELLAWKCGGPKMIVAQDVANEAQLSFADVIRWSKEPSLENIEAHVLAAWCKYLGVTVGQILIYVPDEVTQPSEEVANFVPAN
jgi:DNA-binding Xre family transcriptional regulator